MDLAPSEMLRQSSWPPSTGFSVGMSLQCELKFEVFRASERSEEWASSAVVFLS